MIDDFYNLTLIRGDSDHVTVLLEGEPFIAGYELRLTVRKDFYSKKEIEKKVFEFSEDGKARFDFLPEDTSCMVYGDYVYDVQMTRKNGDVKTIIKPAKFTLLPDVTRR